MEKTNIQSTVKLMHKKKPQEPIWKKPNSLNVDSGTELWGYPRLYRKKGQLENFVLISKRHMKVRRISLNDIPQHFFFKSPEESLNTIYIS